MNKLIQPKYSNARRGEALGTTSFELKLGNSFTNYEELVKPVTFVEFITETYGKEDGYPIQLPEDINDADDIIKCRAYLSHARDK